MSSFAPLGPANAARWENEAIGGEAAYPQWLLVLPDAGNTPDANAPAVFYTLPRMPAVARTPDGNPVFSLTLVLSRLPKTPDESLAPLIERGELTFTLDLSAAPDALRRLEEKRRRAGRLYDSFYPLFARSILATVDDNSRTIASSSASGADALLTFSALLDCAHALAVLDALEGTPGTLRVLLDIGYGAVSVSSETTPVDGGLSDILRTLTLEAPLHALFGDLLGSARRDRFIRLVTRADSDAAPRDVLVRLHEGNS